MTELFQSDFSCADNSTKCAIEVKHKLSFEGVFALRQNVLMTLGQRIRHFRKRANLSQAELANELGYPEGKGQTTIGSWERNRTEPTRDMVRKLADVLKIDLAELEGVSEDATGADIQIPQQKPVAENATGPRDTKMVPLLGYVQAGVWIEVYEADYPLEYIAFSDPQYDRASVFALTVRGPSMNLLYPEDTTIFVVPSAESGVRDGDIVVIKRTDAAGKAEYTLKEVEERDGAVMLCPRSTDPRYQAPLQLPPRDLVANDGFEIMGVVIGSYVKGKPRTGRLLTI